MLEGSNLLKMKRGSVHITLSKVLPSPCTFAAAPIDSYADYRMIRIRRKALPYQVFSSALSAAACSFLAAVLAYEVIGHSPQWTMDLSLSLAVSANDKVILCCFPVAREWRGQHIFFLPLSCAVCFNGGSCDPWHVRLAISRQLLRDPTT